MFNRPTRGVLIAVCIILFTIGVALASLGPILPDLQTRTGASLGALGAIFTAWFAGSLVTQVAIGVIGERLGWRRLLTLELGVMAVGVLGVTLSPSLPIALLWGVIAGMGQGGADVSASVLAAEVFATRSVAALNFVNVFFGLGAISGPALVSLALHLWHTGLPVLWLAALLGLAVIPWCLRAPALSRPIAHAEHRHERAQVLRAPLLWALGSFFLIYVGAETAVGGWTTEYLQRTTPLSLEVAALATSGFWLSLTVARLVMVALERRLAGRAARDPATAQALGWGAVLYLLIALVGATLGGALLVAGRGHAAFSIGAVLLLGLSFGPLYPTALAVTTGAFATASSRAAGVVVALGSIGGALLPWLQGLLLTRTGPGASAVFVALMCLAMLGIVGGVQAVFNRNVS